jgi:hypothetical protein
MSLNSLNDKVANAIDDSKDEGYIIGVVTDNNDPLGINRIKVNVPNLFDTNQGDVPWIGPAKKSPFGQGTDYGVYGSPAIGSKVRIRLQNNDPHYGIYEADEYVAADANPTFASPNTWGFKDPSGNQLLVNLETKGWQFTHSSGLMLNYDADGNRTSAIPGNEEETISGNETHTVTGTLSISSTGAMSISSQANISITSSASITISGTSVNIT